VLNLKRYYDNTIQAIENWILKVIFSVAKIKIIEIKTLG